MSDAILSVYSDARTEYTKQLCAFLVPSYFQFFLSLLDKGREGAEAKKLLWTFQTLLTDIPEWNMEKVNTEIEHLQTACGCDYMDDLLTAVFIAHTKVLTAIRMGSKKKRVQITVPKVEHFMFKVLCETSKLLWGSTYLFREDVTSIEKQQNYRSIEGLLQEGVVQAVRALVPVKSILRDFVSGEDSDDEDEKKGDKKGEEEEEEKGEKEEKEEKKGGDEKEEAVVAAKEEVAVANDTVTELSTPPIICIDEKPEVSFSNFDEVFDSENPDDSDIVEGTREDPPGLEIIDGDSMPLSGDDSIESLDEDAFGKASAPPSDDYEVLV
jgi:hypothetical protein